MENKLDDFFKNKLDEREIVFNEAHWEQAQFMLDEQDEQERRRAWWQYWILGLLGLVLLSGLALYSITEVGLEKSIKETSLDTAATADDYQSMSSIDANVITEQNTTENSIQIAANTVNETATTEDEQVFLNETRRAQQGKKATSNTLVKAKEDKQIALNLASTGPTNIYESKDVKVVKQSKQNAKQDDNSSDVVKQLQRSLDTEQGQMTKKSTNSDGLNVANLSPSEEKNTKVEQTKSEEIKVLIKEQDVISSNEVELTSDEELSKEEQAVLLEKQGFMVVKNLHEDMASIPTLVPVLELPNKELGDAVPIVAATITKPATQKGWRLGITASTLLYPFSNTSELQFAEFPDINPAVKAQQWVGFKVGATARYHLNQRWAMSAGLLYYKQTGTFQSVRSSRQVTYRFGLESTTVDLVPQSLHYLELPILMTRKYHKHSIELGAAFDFLLGVKNTIGVYENIGEDELVLSPQKSTWKYQDGFSRRHVRALLGYQYQVFKSLHLGLRINYTIGGGILDSNYSTSFSGSNARFILLESRPTNVELKMTYYW